MRGIVLILTLFFASLTVKSQNIQLHYDWGKNRKYLTSTVEMFKPDKWGSTYFFIDLDYGSNDIKGVSLAYFEIARGLKYWEPPVEIHVEYNGGFGQFATKNDEGEITGSGSYQINDAWLFGGHYTWNNNDFSRVFTLQGMYKYIRGKNNVSFQITGVWGLHFFDRKLSLMGFADFWREDNDFIDETTRYVFLSEPQFWYNATENLSLGSEIELSVNFAGNKGFMVNPTMAAKWTF